MYECGRLVSSSPEPEFDELERAHFLALAMYRKTRCPNCGRDMVESTDVANDGRYLPMLPVQCHSCVAFSRSHEAYKDAPHPTSLHHRVELRR